MEVVSEINTDHARRLQNVAQLDATLTERFKGRWRTDSTLNRQCVSFQGNKEKPEYRWYKYKEAFSASLVEYLLVKYEVTAGRVLDPFAGMGTTLFASAALGLDADGIELLPIGQQIIRARLALQTISGANRATLRQWCEKRPWQDSPMKMELPVLRITKGAYPQRTLLSIERYFAAMQGEKKEIQRVLRFALLCILESVSYTRKDGQYLRWDQRSGRSQGIRAFDKGRILTFDEAISRKLREIISDSQEPTPIDLFAGTVRPGKINLFPGSCLDVLPALSDESYSAIVTSPPYCNRYDYTRTYALELAALDVDESELSKLRQSMLSCTVENRAKDLLAMNSRWANAVEAANTQAVLQAVLNYLEGLKEVGQINNPGIPRMIRGYFHEMACVISESARVLKRNGFLFMVNDNVRYGGASIPVDLILSDIAEQLGFSIYEILVLAKGKGNSSQQMGAHGRDQLRKCVYIWRKK